ncbi:hypothetical protein GOV03_03605 [Candidatus Woesearchaeota archaeon]|nr:hypothetical protein [Candidatus Woesearchaeota archaeon]
MKKNRKAQIRMSETIAVLFIFFILVVFSLIFYYKYSEVSFKEEQAELMGLRAMDTTLKTLFLPELICSQGKAEPIDNCFDLMKLRHAAEEGVFNKYLSEYYFDLFPYTKITIEQLYPGEGESWVLYDKEKTKQLDDGLMVPDWKNKESTYFVVSLRDELNPDNEYSFGVLTVEVYG